MLLPQAIRVRFWLSAILLVMVGTLAGCGTTDSPNVSSKPWNSPEGYQSNIPGQMLNGR